MQVIYVECSAALNADYNDNERERVIAPFCIRGILVMDNLNFYIVPDTYVTYLQNAEISKRGFTRVPNMNYGNNRKQKFVCGIILKIKDVNYFVSVSSYKHQKPDNFLICDKNGNVVSSLRFNYMFPVPLNIISERRIDTETDLKYKSLLSQELRYCIDNQNTIRNLASRTHKRVLLGKNPGLVNNSCDFELLEEKCQEYTQALNQTQQPILPNQIPPTQCIGGLSQGR